MQNTFIDSLFFYILAVKKLYFKNPRVLIFFFKALCKHMQHCWMLHFVSVCTPCCVLLHDVVCCLLLLTEELPNSLLLHDRQSIAQQSQICLHTSSNIVGAMHVHCTWSPSSLQSLIVLWVYPSHDALQVLTSNNVGSCCVCQHVAYFLIYKLKF